MSEKQELFCKLCNYKTVKIPVTNHHIFYKKCIDCYRIFSLKF